MFPQKALLFVWVFLGLVSAKHSYAGAESGKSRAAKALIEQLNPFPTLPLPRAQNPEPDSSWAAQVMKKIPWIKIPFVDLGDWNGKKVGGNAEENAEASDGSSLSMGDHDSEHGGGTSNKSKKAMGFGYDENRAKTAAETPAPAPPEENRGQPTRLPPGGPSKLQIHDRYYPVCMLIPPSVAGKANSIAKRFVEISNNCKVNVDLHMIPIQEPADPKDADAISKGARETCNAQFGLGVGQASALVATNDPITADVMCNQRKGGVTNARDCFEAGGVWYGKKNACFQTNTAGCAQLCKNDYWTKEQLEKSMGNGDHGNGGFGEGIITSIIDANGQNGAVASHEAFGHSQMCWRNGRLAGNGIGVPGEEKKGNGGFSHGDTDGNYTENGCQQMRNNAFPNTNKIAFDPSFNEYYVDTGKRWALGEPYWTPPGNPTPLAKGPIPPSQDPNLSRGSDPQSAPLPDAVKGESRGQVANLPPGHKKIPKSAVVTVRDQRGQSGIDFNGRSPIQAENGKPGGSDTYGYDESISGAAANNSANPSTASLLTKAALGGGAPTSYGYDEKASKSGASGSANGGQGATANGLIGSNSEGLSVGGEKSEGGDSSLGRDVARRSLASKVGESESSALDGSFFDKMKVPDKEKALLRRGKSLRNADKPAKSVY